MSQVDEFGRAIPASGGPGGGGFGVGGGGSSSSGGGGADHPRDSYYGGPAGGGGNATTYQPGGSSSHRDGGGGYRGGGSGRPRYNSGDYSSGSGGGGGGYYSRYHDSRPPHGSMPPDHVYPQQQPSQHPPPYSPHDPHPSWGSGGGGGGGRGGPPPPYHHRSHYHHHHHHHRSNSSSGPPPPSSSYAALSPGGGGGRRGGPPSSLPPPHHHSSKLLDAAPPPSSSSAVVKMEDPPATTSAVTAPAPPPPHPSLRYVPEPMLCEFLWNEEQNSGGGGSVTKDEENRSLADPTDRTETDKHEKDAKHPTDGDESDTNNKNHKKEDGNNNNNNNNNNSKEMQTYDDYRLHYAWTFLKHFFNQHLDDSWFRQSYSPALIVEGAKLERRRCHAEAHSFRRQLLLMPSEDKTNKTISSMVPKLSLTLSSSPSNHQNYNHISSSTTSSSSSIVTIPSHHLFGMHDRILHVRNVPPHVTDEHIRQALLPYLTEYVTQQQQQQQQNSSKGKEKGGKNSTGSSSSKKQQPSQSDVLETTVFGIFACTPNNSNTPPPSSGGSSTTTSTLPSATASNATTTAATPRGGSVFLHRSVFVVCTTAEVYEGVWKLLLQKDVALPPTSTGAAAATTNPADPNHATSTSTTGGGAASTAAAGGGRSDPVLPKRSKGGGGIGDVHVPRKQDEAAKLLASYAGADLEVDCTDPYGRTEYDANGRGEPPPDGLAVPPRKAVVTVARYEYAGGTLRLSTALSSPMRFETDQEAATTMARALDVRQHVPVEDRLDTILEELGPKINNNNNNNNTLTSMEDTIAKTKPSSSSSSSSAPPPKSLALDIALAYLRRVHLYSFYKGVKGSSFGDVLAGRSPAAQVQLREDVGMPETPEAAELLKDDLLGRRLDDSIRQALEVDCHAWIAAADWYVDETTDTAAQEIAKLEDDATQEWLANHVMDDDGRARCSFHFCHKLFKDESFLSKHLLKKHAAYNAAERAKCHDEYMMAVWERPTTMRPVVPLILVDCGKQFGSHESALSAGAEPRAADPEPALWERKQWQEKFQQEKRQEMRAKQLQQQQSFHNNNNSNNNCGKPPMSSFSGPRSSNFVDVDDMKDETVELDLEQLKVPVVVSNPAKKKKKKRKLL